MRYPTSVAIKKLNEAFKLKEDPFMQDWEIECADSSRINEFLDYYLDHSLSEDERFTLMALILGSFEDYYDLDTPMPKIWLRIKDILTKEYNLHKDHIQYYSCLDADNIKEYFSITLLIREISSK